MHVYGACGEIPSRTSSESACRDAVPHRLETLADRLAGGAEDLEVDRSPEAEVGACGRGSAAEAAVADRRDTGAQALERTEAGDRLHVLEVDPRLALDMKADPVGEPEPVAEPCVYVVLEVRVRVHEAGEDHGVVVVHVASPSSSRRPTAAIVPVSSSIATAPSLIGGPSTGTTQSAETTLT